MEKIIKLNEINLRDPYLLVHGGKYYLYGTNGKNAWSGKADGFDVFVSEDMINFVQKRVFSPTPDFWSDENFWAPEVHEIDGKFFMFASFYSEKKGRKSQILVSDTPDGTFIPLKEPLTPEGWDCLDATFFEENGQRYTVFCHEWTQCQDGEMYSMKLDRNLNPVSDAKLLFRASEAPWTKGFDGGNYVTDGPFLWRLQSGKLAMLWSSNGHKGYAMGMSVSDSVEGPWTHLPEPLVENDGGHGMIFRNKEKIYITYHYPNNPNGAERPRIVEVTETDSHHLTIKK